eukprot:5618513-Ditylum_brightwellii.AAC.1
MACHPHAIHMPPHLDTLVQSLCMNADLDSLDFMYHPCNSSRPCKMDGKCAYKEYSNDRNVKLMSHRSEINGGCKHKPRFHIFGTDDPIMGEK